MTLTSSRPEGRFGALDIEKGGEVSRFTEKPDGDGAWINAGYFVCNYKIFDYIRDGDNSVLEREALEDLAGDGQLFAYRHKGFWRPMDTLRDKKALDDLWYSNKAKWKLW